MSRKKSISSLIHPISFYFMIFSFFSSLLVEATARRFFSSNNFFFFHFGSRSLLYSMLVYSSPTHSKWHAPRHYTTRKSHRDWLPRQRLDFCEKIRLRVGNFIILSRWLFTEQFRLVFHRISITFLIFSIDFPSRIRLPSTNDFQNKMAH